MREHLPGRERLDRGRGGGGGGLTVCVSATGLRAALQTLMILPQVHLRKPRYDFYFL